MYFIYFFLLIFDVLVLNFCMWQNGLKFLPVIFSCTCWYTGYILPLVLVCLSVCLSVSISPQAADWNDWYWDFSDHKHVFFTRFFFIYGLILKNMYIHVYIEKVKFMYCIYRSFVFFSIQVLTILLNLKKNLKKQFKRKRVFGEFNYGSYS